jgi:hypothetical protein
MTAPAEIVDWLRGYYAAMDAGRFDEIAARLHPECRCAYATGHVDVGRDTIIRRSERALGALQGISHDLRGVWLQNDELIFELSVTYRRRDGTAIVRPGMGIFVLDEHRLIREQRLFVDASGVWDP